MLKPLTGDKVNCDMCGKEYEYFIWAFGSDKCLCRGCVRKRPSAYLDDIDAVSLDKEEQLVYDEIEEQEIKEGRVLKQWIKPTKKPPDYQKEWLKMEKKTIAEFRRKEKHGTQKSI